MSKTYNFYNNIQKRSMKRIILTLLLVCVVFSYTYKIQSQSQCLTYDPTYKVCSKWSQSGTIDQDVSCFIGQTLVKEQTQGFIQIQNLEVGDKILTLKKGKETWSEVQGWLHRSDQIKGQFHNITLENGEWIGVSGKHNIAFMSDQKLYEYKFPSDSVESQKLYPCSRKVNSKQTFISVGKYAPLTSEYSYLIYTPTTFEPILVHDFANIRNPEMYEIITDAIFGVSVMINGGHKLNKEGVNFAADWMMKNFGFLME